MKSLETYYELLNEIEVIYLSPRKENGAFYAQCRIDGIDYIHIYDAISVEEVAERFPGWEWGWKEFDSSNTFAFREGEEHKMDFVKFIGRRSFMDASLFYVNYENLLEKQNSTERV